MYAASLEKQGISLVDRILRFDPKIWLWRLFLFFAQDLVRKSQK